ncbi:MAG: SGNH/GDSL hydrolase family protein [Xanthomonadales bacterium]|nr:SGNH/GDSL hydrolase family protein [Xanthomonadales bacterium]
MATPENNTKAKPNAWLNLLLVLVFSAGALWLADLGFRAYERHFLLPIYPDIEGVEPINLAQLRYNEGVVSRELADDEFRILSFGDSFTHSVMQPDLSYNGIVQQQLNDALQDKTVRVVNLGEPGTGPNSFRAAHDFWSQIFEHQAVLFHIFLGNDVQDDAYLTSPLVWEPNIAVLQASNDLLDAGSRRVPNKFPLRMLDYAYAAWLSRKTTAAAELPPGYNWAALTELDAEAFAHTYFVFLDVTDPKKLPALLPGYQQVMLLLQRAQSLVEQGIKVAVLLGPSEPMVDDELRAEVFAAEAANAANYDLGLPARIISELQQRVAPNVPLLDMTQAFRGQFQSSADKLYFRRNTHWNLVGNQLAGDEISSFLLQHWFGQAPAEMLQQDTGWPGPKLFSQAELNNYLQPLFNDPSKVLPQVSGAARSMQMFDGIKGNADNWAMAELGQGIELEWDDALDLTMVRVYLHHADGRRYGLLVEAQYGLLEGDTWQIVSDRRNETVSGELTITLPGMPLHALRITGTSNSKQAENPDNHFIHIEELEWFE